MSVREVERLKEKIVEQYKAKTPTSAKYFEEAQKAIRRALPSRERRRTGAAYGPREGSPRADAIRS